MGSFYYDMEKIISEHGERGMVSLEHYYALNMELLRQDKKDAYSDIHGRNAGGPTKKICNMEGILVNDDFIPSDTMYSGNFEIGFLYTRDGERILAGDTIKVKTVDGKIRRYRIREQKNIGFTTEIYTKWEISSIAN
jgi:hypothetical protein